MFKFGIWPKASGIGPDKALYASRMVFKDETFPNDSGILPERFYFQ